MSPEDWPLKTAAWHVDGKGAMNDWDSARQHLVLTSLGLFAAAFLGIGSYVHFVDHASLYEGCVAGVGCGLICVLASLSAMGIGGQRLALPPLRRFTVFDVVVTFAGLAVLVVGIGGGHWSIALAGLPLISFGIGMTFARHVILRRRERRRS